MAFILHNNGPIGRRKAERIMTAKDLAAYLLKDQQFVFYWKRGHAVREWVRRTIVLNPPGERLYAITEPTEEEWAELMQALEHQHPTQHP